MTGLSQGTDVLICSVDPGKGMCEGAQRKPATGGFRAHLPPCSPLSPLRKFHVFPLLLAGSQAKQKLAS